MAWLPPTEIHRRRAKEIFARWVRGKTLEQIGVEEDLTAEEVHRIVTGHVKATHSTWYKWKLAETRCKAMAMELRLLRVGKEAPLDRPIETLEPPKFWLEAFKAAGIDTVNQLRAVDSGLLYSHRKFPHGAVGWAILKLDRLGLSHSLVRYVIKRRRRGPQYHKVI